MEAQAKEKQEKETVKAAAGELMHKDEYEFTFYDPQDEVCDLTTEEEAGTFKSVVEYYKNGEVSTPEGTESIWDVKYYNTMFPTRNDELSSGWNNSELITRSSVNDLSNEQSLYDADPEGDQTNGSISVQLDGGGVPTIGWTFPLVDSTIENVSNEFENYGRWITTINGGVEQTDRVSTEPGVRVSNSAGDIGFDHSHKLTYVQDPVACGVGYEIDEKVGYTGVLRRILSDL
ncbi:MAG: hypothetical protein M0Z65_04275 [Firmicutes bacterium]|nr:hypothetical protein [Melghirimyces thermohalophilus]MDA8352400.1 hypothetical protein [Bacillota bacterium]